MSSQDSASQFRKSFGYGALFGAAVVVIIWFLV